MATPPFTSQKDSKMRRQAGFTLIELMVTVAVIGILAAVAIPSYLEHILKSRRAEAQSVLMDIGTRQQQRLLDVRSYAATTAALNITVPATVSAHYTIAINAPAGAIPPTFTVTATPQGGQTKDKCGTLGIDNANTKTAIKGGVAQTGCW